MQPHPSRPIPSHAGTSSQRRWMTTQRCMHQVRQYTSAYTCAYTLTHAAHSPASARIDARKHSPAHTRLHADTDPLTHTSLRRTHVDTHTHLPAHARTCACTRTCAQRWSRWGGHLGLRRSISAEASPTCAERRRSVPVSTLRTPSSMSKSYRPAFLRWRTAQPSLPQCLRAPAQPYGRAVQRAGGAGGTLEEIFGTAEPVAPRSSHTSLLASCALHLWNANG